MLAYSLTYGLLFKEIHLNLGGVHIHHFVYGIIGLVVFGILGMMRIYMKGLLPFAYGVFLFLLVDESAMWIKLIQNDVGDPLKYAGRWVVSIILLFFCGMSFLKKKSS